MINILAGVEGQKSDSPCATCRSPRTYWVDINHDLSTFFWPDRSKQNEFLERIRILERDYGNFSKDYSWALFGEKCKPHLGSSKLIYDTLHNATNHGSELVNVTMKFIKGASLRIEFNKDISKLTKNSELELHNLIMPSKADDIRCTLAAIATLLREEEKRNYYFPKKPGLAEILFDCCYSLSCFYKSIYVSSLPSDTTILESSALCFLHCSHVDHLLKNYPNFNSESESDWIHSKNTTQTRSKSQSSQNQQPKYKESENSEEKREEDSEFFTTSNESINMNKESKSKFDTPLSLLAFTYLHILIRHMFLLLRRHTNSDLVCEKDEGSWPPLKKYMKYIARKYAYKAACIKEDTYRIISQKMAKILNNDHKIRMPFFKDMGGSVFIPRNFIYNKKGKFNNFFIFFSKFILDMPNSRLEETEEGVKINCKKNSPNSDEMEYIPPESSEAETLAIIEKAFLKKLEYGQSNPSSSPPNILQRVYNSEEYFEFNERRLDHIWWFKYDILINCITTLKRLNGFIEWSKNVGCNVPDTSKVENTKVFDEKLNLLRGICKNIYDGDNQTIIDKYFPDIKQDSPQDQMDLSDKEDI